ncbi:MAG: hypothetical protein 2 [Wei-like virus sp.]|nr:MAG: hypothetical protein 2 [Weivirus-like virus sp.]
MVTPMTYMLDEATLCGKLEANQHPGISGGADVQDLKVYLARPHAWTSGTFGTGPGSQVVLSIDTYADLLALLGPTTLDRMKGSRGFRATLCFKVVVSATPFHQGIANLSFQYGALDQNNANCRALYYYKSTDLPHVMLDISESTSVELRVPYLSPYEYFGGFSDGESLDYGAIALTRLTDFRLAGTQVAARYTIYVWLEDVELVGAVPFELSTVLLQAGSSVNELKESKLISRGLEATARVAGAIGSIPSLRPIMTSTAWFARLAAGVASSFGYSKPVDQTIVKRRLLTTYGGEAHIDMPTSSFKASPFQTNELRVGPVSGTVADEMSFDYIFSKPSYVFRKEIASTVAAGDLIYASRVYPKAFWFRDNSGSGNIPFPAQATLTTNALAPSHLCYVGDNFRYWRGSIRYHFKFSKTKMHGGRVVVNFVPYANSAVSAPVSSSAIIPTAGAFGTDLSGLTKVFDLKDGSEFTYDVPFIYPFPFASTNTSIGTLTMHMIAPLNSPTNSASTIDMMVFVSALPGFEFAGLQGSIMDGVPFNSTPVVYTQSGGATLSDDVSMDTIGERFTSVKQIAMVPDFHIGPDKANATISAFVLPPWFRKNSLFPFANPIANNVQAVWFGSKSGRMAEMFAFVNGSTEIVAYHDGPDTNVAMHVSVSPIDGSGSVTGVSSLYVKNPAALGHTVMEYGQSALRVNLPAYAAAKRIPFYVYNNGAGTSETTDLTSFVTTYPLMRHAYFFRFRNNSGSARRLVITRAAGDDATMGQYIGPPLVCFFQSTSTVSPNPSAVI